MGRIPEDRMLPFDLEKAKNGHPVCDARGCPVRLVCFDAKSPQPLLGLVNEDDDREFSGHWNSNGMYDYSGRYTSKYDLRLVKQTVVMWVNLYRHRVSSDKVDGQLPITEQLAKSNAATYSPDYLGTFPVEIQA